MEKLGTSTVTTVRFTEPYRAILRMRFSMDRFSWMKQLMVSSAVCSCHILLHPPGSLHLYHGSINFYHSYMSTPISLQHTIHITVSSPVNQEVQNVPANISPTRRQKKKATVAKQTDKQVWTLDDEKILGMLFILWYESCSDPFPQLRHIQSGGQKCTNTMMCPLSTATRHNR
jgi:hypothetical protein